MKRPLLTPDSLRVALPVVALATILIAIYVIRPNAMSYNGNHLLFRQVLPLALATLAQMVILSVNDIDLSLGQFVSFVTCVTVTFLAQSPLIGVLILVASVAAYALIGAVIAWRGLPAIVVTLGMSFVWNGLAVMILPVPGGAPPVWVSALTDWRPPVLPLGILATAVVALFAHLLIMRSSFGVPIRGLGGNERSVARSGWSVIRARAAAYATAAGFAIAAGITLSGIMTSGDANIALNYTLFSIAGAILGGAEFTGGRVSAIGAVIGAATFQLATRFMTFINLPNDWQIGAQGLILIAILGLRLALSRLARPV